MVFTYNDDAPILQDPYVYSDTNVLVNRFGINDYTLLNQKEKEVIKSRLTSELFKEFSGQAIDVELVKSIHRYLFENIFDWAGEFRTVPLYKEERFFIPGLSLTYSKPDNIERELDAILRHLNTIRRWNQADKKQCIGLLTEYLVKMWRVLPFRDGNVRTIIAFAGIFLYKHNVAINIENVASLLSRPVFADGREGLSLRDMFVGAALDEKPDSSFLEHALNL